MWLKAVVEKHRKENMNTALIMTDVEAAFPGTRPSTVLRTLAPLVDPKIYRWILDWLSVRAIALSVDGIQSPQQSSRCGIPQGSPLSPVHFGLVCAATLKGLPSGASYVDDCSWAIPFLSPQQLQRDSHRLLDAVKDRFEMHELSLDIGKLEIAFISEEYTDFQTIQNREQEVEGQLGRETTTDTGYNKMARILPRSIP
jgi:hypothetical protein